MSGLHDSDILLDQARQRLRVEVCPQCYQRWPGQLADPRQPRACEPTCTIFASMPQLLIAALECSPATTAESAVRRYVCMACLASPTSGTDFCSDRMTRTCPLSRYASQVLSLLKEVQQHGFIEHIPGPSA